MRALHRRRLGRPYGEVPAVRGSFSVRPPAEPDVPDFPASGSLVTYAVALTEDSQYGLAFCISHTFLSLVSGHLFPFALQAAFPPPLAGRYSCDYYGNSVAIGLASLRRSRVRLRHT